MITDIDIIHLITTKQRGGVIEYVPKSGINIGNIYLVEDDHQWDFKHNNYKIIHRYPPQNDIA